MCVMVVVVVVIVVVRVTVVKVVGVRAENSDCGGDIDGGDDCDGGGCCFYSSGKGDCGDNGENSGENVGVCSDEVVMVAVWMLVVGVTMVMVIVMLLTWVQWRS